MQLLFRENNKKEVITHNLMTDRPAGKNWEVRLLKNILPLIFSLMTVASKLLFKSFTKKNKDDITCKREVQ